MYGAPSRLCTATSVCMCLRPVETVDRKRQLTVARSDRVCLRCCVGPEATDAVAFEQPMPNTKSSAAAELFTRNLIDTGSLSGPERTVARWRPSADVGDFDLSRTQRPSVA